MKHLKNIALVACLPAFTASVQAQSVSDESYNVLFIGIDDLNDWVGFLDGNSQSLTPNMNRLAREGMVFERAYCASSLCNPSRTAIMSGFRPSTTGIYRNYDDLRSSPLLENAWMLPQWLSRYGYYSLSRGKIYHTPETCNDTWDEWVAVNGDYGKPSGNPPAGTGYNGIPGTDLFDWGPTSMKPEDTPDYRNALWAADVLTKRNFDKPFFLACGIFRPHLRWFVPSEYFNKFLPDTLKLPEVDENDLDDIPGMSPTIDYQNVIRYDKQKEAVQAYLASINYADDCVGVILDALNNSPYKDNTIVILWGDHGWHLGEKLRYRKFTLWEEACRTPLIIKVPGMTKAGSRSPELVNLIDLYPTITELCNIPPNTNNEGNSLVPILKDEAENENFVSWTVTMEDEYTIRSNDYRFIQRKGVPEEFYHESTDPLEHENLIENSAYSQYVDNYKYTLDSILFRTGQISTPVRANLIPGGIQAEKFDRGGEGNAYKDLSPGNAGFTGNSIYYRDQEDVDIYPCNDEGGGMMVSDIEAGEWLNYTLDSVKEGRYRISCRVSGERGQAVKMKFMLNDRLLFLFSSSVQVNDGEWTDLEFEGFIPETSGSGALKIIFETGSFNLNYIKFTGSEEVLSSNLPVKQESIQIYPSPYNHSIYVNVAEIDDDVSVSLFDLQGKEYYRQNRVSESVNIPVKSCWPAGVYLVRLSGTYNNLTRKVIIY